GKLQSKHACTRRENPEGGAFKEAVDCVGEVDRNEDKQPYVVMTLFVYVLWSKDSQWIIMDKPKQRNKTNKYIFRGVWPGDTRLRAGKKIFKLHIFYSSMLILEWMITLYDLDNNGKVTRENMLSLMHTIYEVVEVSVKQLVLSNGTTLRVKLSIAPLTRGNRKYRDIKILRDEQDQMKDNIRCAEGQPSHIRGQNSCNMGVPERKHYSVDENTERRNHYLDLAGIENYSSQFEAEPSSEDVPYRGHQHRSHIENHSFVEFTGRSVSFLRSLRSRSKSIGGSGGTAKPSKLHGYHPVTWCQPSQQHSSSKRIRTRARDITAPSRANQGLHRELQPGQAVPPGGFKYVPQRHEHYHHHEHHHHHYHHYHPT
ncbi:naked cuticle-like protein 3, partial [Triplophysa rosa]